MLECLLTEKYPPKYAQEWPFSLATNCPNSLFHLRQIIPTTFHNFHVHKCISWDILSPGRKWDILSNGTICRLKNVSWSMVFFYICRLPEIGPKTAQDISKICPRYAQALPRVERERFIPSHNIVKICSQNHCALQFVRLEEQHGHNWSSSWSSLDVLVGSLVLLFFFFIFLDGTTSRLHISLRTVGINLCTYAMTC